MSSGPGAALSCQDVLYEVFSHLKPFYLDKEEHLEEADLLRLRIERQSVRHTLASAALASRRLSRVALSALWGTLEDIVVLLKILPSFQELSSTSQRPFILSRNISAKDWSRFQQYARYVKELRADCNTDISRVRPSVWALINARCSGSPLLPRLHRMDLTLGSRVESISYIILLLSPTIRSAKFLLSNTHTNDYEPDFRTLLDALSHTAPRLRQLRVEGSATMRLSSEIFDSVMSFPMLRHLALDTGAFLTLSRTALSTLASFRRIHTLTIAFTVEGSDSSKLFFEDAFPDLQIITLSGPADVLTTFMRGLASPRLHTACFDFGDADPFSIVLDFIRTSPKALPSSLKVISLRACEDETVDEPISLKAMIEPLFHFRELTGVFIDIEASRIRMSDDDVRSLISAWPKLTDLDISYEPVYGHPELQRLTPAALLEFAQRCPILTHLSLGDIDINAGFDPCVVPVLNRGLRELEFDRCYSNVSVDQAPPAFAMILDRLFPNLRNVQQMSAEDLRSSASDVWRVTKHYLALFQQGRANRWE